jgi:hypothetical protein
MYALLGAPPWPTSPEIDPGAPAYSFPLLVPFQVRNPSGLFSIMNPSFACHIEKMTGSAGQGVEDVTVMAHPSTVEMKIGPKGEAPFQCPFLFRFGTGIVLIARMNIEVDRDWPLLGSSLSGWLGRWHTAIGPFTWDPSVNPPRWVKGEPLH